MRLTEMEQQIIISSFRKHYPKGDALYLFGSRMDDGKIGGDIDLYIDTTLDSADAYYAQMHFLIEIKQAIGKEIDIVLHSKHMFKRPIDLIATHGVRLV